MEKEAILTSCILRIERPGNVICEHVAFLVGRISQMKPEALFNEILPGKERPPTFGSFLPWWATVSCFVPFVEQLLIMSVLATSIAALCAVQSSSDTFLIGMFFYKVAGEPSDCAVIGDEGASRALLPVQSVP